MPYPIAPLFLPGIRVIDSTRSEPQEETILSGPRTRGSRRPHGDGKHAQVRRLIETTRMTYGEIAKATGVGRASICRWTQDGQWQRPFYAPVATDTVPSARASRKLRLRKLGERLYLLADRMLRDLEARPDVTPEALLQALQVVKMARAEAMGRRRRRRDPDGVPRTGAWFASRDEAIVTALKEMRRATGLDTRHIPDEAMALLEAAHPRPEDEPDHPMLNGRRRRRRR
jgi:hypothetical protein